MIFGLFRKIADKMWQEQRPAVLIILFCFLTLSFFTFKKHHVSDNPRSRIITVERLLEKGTFAHYTENDTTPFELSADAVMINGNLYSSKPPIYPVVMAAEAWPVRAITGMNFYENQRGYLRYLVMMNQVIPYTLFLFVVLYFGMQFSSDKWTLSLLVTAMSIGILPFAYAPVINNHTPAAILLFAGFAIYYFIMYKQLESLWAYAGAGLLLGVVGMLDLPGLGFMAFFLLLLFVHNWRKALVAVAGALVPIMASIGLYYVISGRPIPFYLQSGLYDYAGSFLAEDRKLRTFSEPRLNYLFHSLFGHHGILAMTPVLLLGVAGIFHKFIKKGTSLRLEYAGILVCIVAVIIFVVSRTYNYGGWCIGMRWYMLFMPILLFAGMELFEKLAKNWAGRVAIMVLIALALPHIAQALFETAFKQSNWELWWIGG